MERKLKVGDIVYGTVSGIQRYGVFVELDHGYQGLIHISEAKNGYVKNLHQIVHVGDRVRVMIIDINEYNQKISLSLRVLEQKNKSSILSGNRPKNLNKESRKKTFFTNHRSNIGFSTIKNELPYWIEEAKEKISKKK
ncbi:CvfD/Ygs/GSP13 family RNA-binding post-transcriptional regulator [Xylocopilactobacillus apicola]|uniref:General stress protein 13 n=1 Tax=Xylocopilactobacillus apicola TaxID=2932184 RepID=A0AAU9DR72_9LACO|nr:CvfD/Ygs/GSP13 family RNA-binding post-transcriptional regulator [Xylocopilactobacillus apicola]BDR58429.1 general stress protein 13 [Xylocopilactobacillus apicola]